MWYYIKNTLFCEFITLCLQTSKVYYSPQQININVWTASINKFLRRMFTGQKTEKTEKIIVLSLIFWGLLGYLVPKYF